MYLAAEAALLGLGSGPACLASCGPVLVPSLAAQGRGIRGTAGLLGVFLSGRLAGYLVFAVAAWTFGQAAPGDACARALLFGAVNLGLAALLAASAWRRPRPHLVSIETKRRRAWPLAGLGLLSGLNVCPPFVAAGMRAGQMENLAAAVLFFLVFFAGTAVWSLPLVALGWARRAAEVARLTAWVVAAWYGYLGVVSLLGRWSHGC